MFLLFYFSICFQYIDLWHNMQTLDRKLVLGKFVKNKNPFKYWWNHYSNKHINCPFTFCRRYSLRGLLNLMMILIYSFNRFETIFYSFLFQHRLFTLIIAVDFRRVYWGDTYTKEKRKKKRKQLECFQRHNIAISDA